MTIQQIDFSILEWIQANLKCGFLDFLMPKVTLLAEGGVFLILIGLALLFWKSRRLCGAAELTGLTIGLLLCNLLLKNLVARQRPCWINTGVQLLVANPTDYSFPSGHTLHCFIAAAVLLYYDRRLGWPMLAVAVLVAISRLYLYVHFPSDVLAGAVLGAAIGWLTAYVFDRVYKRKKAKKTAAV